MPFEFDCLNDWGVHEPSGFEFKFSGLELAPSPISSGIILLREVDFKVLDFGWTFPAIKAVDTKFVIETKLNMVSGTPLDSIVLVVHGLVISFLLFCAWDS